VTQYFAHSANKAGSPWEPLKEHLQCVAKRASEYADVFGAKEEAAIAGLWHDLGKYSELFTKRLRGEMSGLDHWSTGALATLISFRDKAVAAGLAVQGHHIGLQEGFSQRIRDDLDITRLSDPATHPLGLTLTEPNIKALLERFKADEFVMPSAPQVPLYDFVAPSAAAMLDVRMLFSALVDADYIETEAHFEGKSDGTKVYRYEGPGLQAKKAFEILSVHLEELERVTKSSQSVRRIRKHLLDTCLKKAGLPTGIFTLTAPTGAGKTLAMLAFALKHSIANTKIRRIVMVVPFLSIIEQTAKVYRQLFEPHLGSLYILEHHSLVGASREGRGDQLNLDNEEEARRLARLLAENWDAPLVITTSVQLFESLFANSPAKCRKLHRLADSIILFDEVQTLPSRIVIPSLAALSRFTERYGCTVVFSTATQPAFDHLSEKVKPYATTGWRPQNIVEDSLSIFNQARRVQIDWQVEQTRSWESVAGDLAKNENSQSLCIVNLKRHAQILTMHLYKLIDKDGLFHLSTNMCPAHRVKVLKEVCVRLRPDNLRPCRLISTQCVEAGVDIDFPVAWRAFGPLDAIAQAAGRCNREGRLDGLGRMVVFLPEKEHDREYLYPPGGYKQATETTRTLFEEKKNEAFRKGISFENIFDIYDPELFNQYYRLLYSLTRATELDLDLEDALQRRSFVDVAQHYRLIGPSINVLVPYSDEIDLFESLKRRLDKEGRLTRQWIQDARPLTVSLYRPKSGDTVWNYLYPVPLGCGEQADDWFIYLNKEDYDSLLGLKPPDEGGAWMT
jgi:CRISPR-associated helicase Cas3/CRISPR-associated endonuclease Cas3-HD